MKNKFTQQPDNREVIFYRSFLITTGLILFFLCVLVWRNNEHGLVFYLIEIIFFFMSIACLYGGILSSDEEILRESEKMDMREDGSLFFPFVSIVSYPVFLVLLWLWGDK